MWKPQNISLLLAGLVLLTACSSSKFSTRKEEQRTVAIISDPKNDLLASASMGRPVKIRGGAGATALLGGAITLGVNGVKKMIEANRKKYNVEYQASQRELYFYHDISKDSAGMLDPTGIRFKGIEVTRTVNKGETALYAALEMDTEDTDEIVENSTFHLKLKDLKLAYTAAKIPARTWYAPWTWFIKEVDKINLEMEVVIRATWFSPNGNYFNNEPIGRFRVFAHGMPIDPVEQRAWLDTAKTSPLRKRADGYSMLVPRSYSSFVRSKVGSNPIYDWSYGQGLYNIEVIVKEQSKESLGLKVVGENYDTIMKYGREGAKLPK